MPLLTATCAFGLGRRYWSSPQQCYLHCFRTTDKLLSYVKYGNEHQGSDDWPLAVSNVADDAEDQWPAVTQLLGVVLKYLQDTLELALSHVHVGDCTQLLQRRQQLHLQQLEQQQNDTVWLQHKNSRPIFRSSYDTMRNNMVFYMHSKTDW